MFINKNREEEFKEGIVKILFNLSMGNLWCVNLTALSTKLKTIDFLYWKRYSCLIYVWWLGFPASQVYFITCIRRSSFVNIGIFTFV